MLRGEFENLWPLQLVDLRDEEMVGTLFRLLRRVPQVLLFGCAVVCRVFVCFGLGDCSKCSMRKAIFPLLDLGLVFRCCTRDR